MKPFQPAGDAFGGLFFFESPGGIDCPLKKGVAELVIFFYVCEAVHKMGKKERYHLAGTIFACENSFILFAKNKAGRHDFREIINCGRGFFPVDQRCVAHQEIAFLIGYKLRCKGAGPGKRLGNRGSGV